MRGPLFQGVGGVLSADIAVPDHERELGFYARVLTTGSEPLWRDDLANNQGTPIIGLGERVPEYDALHLQWGPHFQVADVAASAARTVELGGQELFHGKDDDGQSQWAALIDPAGASFGVVLVVDDETYGVSQLEGNGCITWLSLVASDVSSMSAFYEQVIGLTAGPADSGSGREMRRPDGVAAAAICPMDDYNQAVPPVWLIHLPVGDFAESLRQVREGGGEIVWEAREAGQAVIRDPVGVYVALQAHK